MNVFYCFWKILKMIVVNQHHRLLGINALSHKIPYRTHHVLDSQNDA